MKQIKDLPKDWALYLGDTSMNNWTEALACCNELTDNAYEGTSKFYTELSNYNYLEKYCKILTPEEFVYHFEIEPTIKDELAAMRYEVGDTIVNNNCERRVLGVCGLVYFVSENRKPDEACTKTYTQKELDKLKYKKKL